MKAVSTGCAHDCGGKCLLHVFKSGDNVLTIRDGGIREPIAKRLGIKACARGLTYHRRVFHQDRLKKPLMQKGERGRGEFKPVSWKVALKRVAEALLEAKEEYGPASILNLSGSGSYTALLHNTRRLTSRLLNMFGGCTDLKGGYSIEAGKVASHYAYGTAKTDHDRGDLVNSKLILMWGWNPVETLFGSHTITHLHKAKRRGSLLICIDPRKTPTSEFSHQWIPIKPGTDVALANAMAYEILRRGLQDEEFIEKHTVGLPKYRGYLFGEEDGEPKTPSWAESRTGIPTDTIENLAFTYASMKPAALMPGWGPQRTAYGEQFIRATSVLASITGNIGIPGGNPAGANMGVGPSEDDASIPVPPNPTGIQIPKYLWPSIILEGKKGGYPSDIHLAYIAGSNYLNQHANIKRTIKALEKLQTIIVHEQFLTPTADYADILLPTCTFMERMDILIPWAGYGNYVIYQNKVIDPLYESKTDLWVFTELSRILGFKSSFNPYGEEEWLKRFAAKLGIKNYSAFKRRGIHFFADRPTIPFREQIEEGRPFPTPSGKIEIYSSQLASLNDPAIPPIPRYIEPWEGPEEAKRNRFPLQLVTPKHRFWINSTLSNLDSGVGVKKRLIQIHPINAEKRRMSRGDGVKVFNTRGATILHADVTDKIMPDVVAVKEGSWYKPGSGGVDLNGSINVVTSERPTPLGKAATQHTSLVEVLII